jgi:hypothetical protein
MQASMTSAYRGSWGPWTGFCRAATATPNARVIPNVPKTMDKRRFPIIVYFLTMIDAVVDPPGG